MSKLTADPSGLPVNVVGSARLQVTFAPAARHNANGILTYGSAQRTYL